MSIKIPMPLEPNGTTFKVVDAKDISITANGTRYSLSDYLMATPVISDVKTSITGQELAIEANISSPTPGGSSVRFFILDMQGNNAVTPILINNAVGDVSVKSNLPIGQYQFYITATNQNGTSRYPEGDESKDGPYRVGSIVVNNLKRFGSQFESTFIAEQTNYIKTSIYGLSFDFVAPVKSLDIKFTIDKSDYIEFLDLEPEGLTVTLHRDFVNPVTSYTCTENDIIAFTPRLSGLKVVSTTMCVDVAAVISDDDSCITTAFGNNYTIASMMANTAAITDAYFVTSNGDSANTVDAKTVSNNAAAYINVLGYTSSQDLRTTGFPIKITYSWGDEQNPNIAYYYPRQKVFHGQYAKLSIFAPETMRNGSQDTQIISITVEPDISESYNKGSVLISEAYHKYVAKVNDYEKNGLLIDFSPIDMKINNDAQAIENASAATNNTFQSAKLCWNTEATISVNEAEITSDDISSGDGATAYKKTFMRIPPATELTLMYNSETAADNLLHVLLDSPDSLATGPNTKPIFGRAFTIDMCFKLPEDPKLTVFKLGELFTLVGRKLYIADNSIPIHLIPASDGWCYLAFGYSDDDRLAKTETLYSSTPVMVYLNGVLVYAARNVIASSAEYKFSILPNQEGDKNTAGLDLEYLRIYGADTSVIEPTVNEEDFKCICSASTIENNYIAANDLIRESETNKAIAQVYFVSAPLRAGENYADTGKEWKKKNGISINYHRMTFEGLNKISKKNPEGTSDHASKNTFAAAHIITKDIEDNYKLWAKATEASTTDFDAFNSPDTRIFLQGTSTLAYPVKNYQVKLKSEKKPPTRETDDSWLADKVYTLKCDYMEQSHRNNTPTARYYQDNIVPAIVMNGESEDPSKVSPALTIVNKKQDQLTGNKVAIEPISEIGQKLGYEPRYRDAINGFPVQVFYIDEPDITKFSDIGSIDDTLDAGKLKLETYISEANVQLAGSYMWNIDKEGSQLGFALTETEILESFIDDIDSGASVDADELCEFFGDKLNLTLDNTFNDKYLNDLDLAVTLPGSITNLTEANLSFYIRGDFDADTKTICGYEIPDVDASNPPQYNTAEHCWKWISSDGANNYKLQIQSEILPCISYEGGTNSNAAAAAFIPYRASWDRYLQEAFETGDIRGQNAQGESLRAFPYRVIETDNLGHPYYAMIQNQYNGQDEYKAGSDFTPGVTYSEFLNIIKGDYYDEYSPEDERITTNTFAQKVAGVLSETEFFEIHGDGEIDYLEATLEPRFSYTDKHVTITLSKNEATVEVSDDMIDTISEYLKYKPIRQAIDWVYDCYQKLFHPTDGTTYTINNFKDEFEKYFSKEYCLAYFLQMIVLAQVDNAGKNAMYDTWGDGRLYPRPYDMDTQMGLTNLGTDIVPSDVELSLEISKIYKTDKLDVSNWAETRGDVSGDRFSFYNTAESALWKCFYLAYESDIINVYERCRQAGGVYTVESIMRYIDACTSKVIPIDVYNKDAVTKYLPTLDKLYCIAGTRRARYSSYLDERLKFLDTMWLDSKESPAILWVSANTDSYLTFTSDSPQYVSIYADMTTRIGKVLIRSEDHYTASDGSTAIPGVRVKVNSTALGTTGAKNVYIRGCKYITGISGFSSYPQIESVQLASFENLQALDFANCKLSFGDSTTLPPTLRKLNVSANSVDATKKCTGQLRIISDVIEEINCANSDITGLVVNKASSLESDHCPLAWLDMSNTLKLESLELAYCYELTQMITDYSTSCPVNAIKLCAQTGKQPKLNRLALQKCINLAITKDTKLLNTIQNFNFEGCTKLTGLTLSGKTLNTLYLTGTSITYLDLASATLTNLKLNVSATPQVLDFVRYIPKTLTTLRLTGANVASNCCIILPQTTYNQLLLGKLLKVRSVATASYNSGQSNYNYEEGTWDFTDIEFESTPTLPSREYQFTIQGAPLMQKLSNLHYKGPNINSLLYTSEAGSKDAYRCKQLKTIENCTFELATGSTSLSNMFYFCEKLESINSDLFATKDLQNVKDASGMFEYAKKLPYATVKSLVSQMSCLENFSSGMYGYGLDLNAPFELIVGELFHSSAINKITALNNAFNDSKVGKVIGSLPPKITSAQRMFYSCNDLEDVDVDLIVNCTELTNLSNAFYGCNKLNAPIKLPCYYDDGGNLISEGSKIQTIAGMYAGCSELKLEHASGPIASFYEAFTGGNTDTVQKGDKTLSNVTYDMYAKTALGKVIYADGVFENCQYLNLNLENFLDYLPKVEYLDGMFYRSGVTKLPGSLAENPNENVHTCRGLFANLTLDYTESVMLDEGWLSSAMPNVRYIGATHYPRTYSPNLEDTESKQTAMVNSSNIAISAKLNMIDYDSRTTDEHLDFRKDTGESANTYFVRTHNVGWPSENNTASRRHLPGILANIKTSGADIKLQVPINLFTNLPLLRDCSFALTCLPVYSTNSEGYVEFTDANEDKKSTGVIQLIGATSSTNSIFTSENLKNVAYCFAGCTSDLKAIPQLFPTDANKEKQLMCAAGLFAAASFKQLKLKALYECIFPEGLLYNALVDAENLFNFTGAQAATSEDNKLFTDITELPTPALKYAAGMFANIRVASEAVSGAPLHNEIISPALFNKCRQTIESVRGCFYKASGILKLAEGSYSYYLNVPYATTDDIGTNMSSQSAMRKWFNSNRIFGLSDALKGDLRYNVNTNNVSWNCESLNSQNITTYCATLKNLPRATATGELCLVIDGEERINKKYIVIKKSVNDVSSGSLVWETCGDSELNTLLGISSGDPSYINQEDSEGCIWVFNQETSQTSWYSTSELLKDENDFISNSLGLGQNAPELVVFNYKSLLTNTELCSPIEYYNSSAAHKDIYQPGIFGNCPNLIDASFCFAYCGTIESAIPRDLFYGSNNLESIRGVFAYCTGMYLANDSAEIQVRFNDEDVAEKYSIPLANQVSKLGTTRNVYPAVYQTNSAIAFVDSNEADNDFYFLPDDWITSQKLSDISFAFTSVGYNKYQSIVGGAVDTVKSASLDFAGKFVQDNSIVKADYAFAHCLVFGNADLGNVTTGDISYPLFGKSNSSLISAQSMFERASVAGLYLFNKNKMYSRLTDIKKIAYDLKLIGGVYKLDNSIDMAIVDKCVFKDSEISSYVFPAFDLSGGDSDGTSYDYCFYNLIDMNTDENGQYLVVCSRHEQYNPQSYALEPLSALIGKGFACSRSLRINI